jgi:hypothetical protein
VNEQDDDSHASYAKVRVLPQQPRQLRHVSSNAPRFIEGQHLGDVDAFLADRSLTNFKLRDKICIARDLLSWKFLKTAMLNQCGSKWRRPLCRL